MSENKMKEKIVWTFYDCWYDLDGKLHKWSGRIEDFGESK